MKYDFNKKTNRLENDSAKWTEMKGPFISNDLLPFWVADMDFEASPKIKEALINKANQNIYGYVHTKDNYFESAVNFTKRRHNYEFKKETLVHTTNVALSLCLGVRLFTKPTDKVMISTPSYPPFYESVVKNGRTLVENELVIKNGRYEIDFEDFEKKASDKDVTMYILCNPHNPTGRVWEKEELQKIADICLKHNVRVISDEIWRDLVYTKFTPFASLSKEVEDITITCFSATKTFNLAGLQASFISIPREDELKKFKDELYILHLNKNSSFNVVACEVAFNECDDWLDELINYLKGNLDFIEEFITSNLPKVKFIRPEGTYLLWLDFSEYNIDDISLFMQENAKIALNSGKNFKSDATNFLRLNFATSRDVLKEGLNRMKNALE
jgi:cystathionine beta-lyase